MDTTVLFVCVKNGGKSQMAAGLMRTASVPGVKVLSAGTRPGTAVNTLSVQALAEDGVDISDQQPQPVTTALLDEVDRVITLGSEATIEAPAGTLVENWDTDEPSTRGIDGIDRMRLIRDDIATRVAALAEELRSD